MSELAKSLVTIKGSGVFPIKSTYTFYGTNGTYLGLSAAYSNLFTFNYADGRSYLVLVERNGNGYKGAVFTELEKEIIIDMTDYGEGTITFRLHRNGNYVYFQGKSTVSNTAQWYVVTAYSS